MDVPTMGAGSAAVCMEEAGKEEVLRVAVGSTGRAEYWSVGAETGEDGLEAGAPLRLIKVEGNMPTFPFNSPLNQPLPKSSFKVITSPA